MTILIVGGTGNTGARVARLLKEAGQPILLTTRSGKVPAPFKGVSFDWFEPTTYNSPFDADPNIDRAYLVGPGLLDQFQPMKQFIDLAISKGVKRFVVLGASQTEKGGALMGKAHVYFESVGVDYCVLRPTWFIDNFGQLFLDSIRDEDVIPTSTKDGRIPFIAAEDIAEVAVRALTDEPSHNTDHVILGPELFSYSEAAAELSMVIGRTITHKHVPEEETVRAWAALGTAIDYATAVGAMERTISEGEEEQRFYTENKILGRHRLRDYIQANRDLWIKK